MKVVKYVLTVKDVMRGTTFELEIESKDSLKERYEKYSKDYDYEVVGATEVSLEVKLLNANDLADGTVMQNYNLNGGKYDL